METLLKSHPQFTHLLPFFEESAELSELHIGQIFFCLEYILPLSGFIKEKARSNALLKGEVEALDADLRFNCSFFLS
jgi:hypothetical protein